MLPIGMRQYIVVFLLTLAAFCCASDPRIRIRMDADWKFLRDPLPGPRTSGPFNWSWKPADVSDLQTAVVPPDIDSGNWRSVAVGTDVFHDRVGFAWFRTDLGTDPATEAKSLHFESVDDNAAVFLNGHRLIVHEGWDDPFDVDLRDGWNPAGPNELVVLNENTGGQGGIMGPVEFAVPTPPEVPPDQAKPEYNDSGWRTVHLPHDYVVEGTFDEHADTGHGSLPVTKAWYRKTFTLPASYRGKSLWVDFDGVYHNSTVYLNGHKLGFHAGGYDGFRYDIGLVANYGGTNVLAVRVDATKPEGWWYEGGGIYRHVWLNAADPVHVKPWGTFVTSDLTEPITVARPPAGLTIQTDLANDSGREQQALVESTIIAPDGRQVASVSSVQSVPASGAQYVQKAAVPAADLWSIESPSLYRLETTVKVDGTTVDRVETSFGIRTLRYDANKGFFLNGKHVEIQGTCNHQDHAGLGIAIPDGMFYWRVARLKEMGSNAYRCSHNPPASALLDACDRLGMIVMDESRHLGDTESPKSSVKTPYSDLSELKSMVLRDRNHPSIVMWSMCNEEGISGTEAGARIFAAMRDVTKSLDPTRPVTCAMNFGWGTGISLVQDIQGFNYGIYAYDPYHMKFPEVPCFGSETASAVGTRGIYTTDPAKGYVSAYDANRPGWGQTAEGAWEPIAVRPWMEGGFVWTGFDYKGEPTPYGWPCINSHFGIMDICGFPKDSFYYYQSVWGQKPMVHILPHWNWPGKEGQPISVWCYSNADSVELFLNGKSLGAKPMPKYEHLEWAVPYAPGELIAKVYRDGKVIATDKVATTGPAAALRLKVDRTSLIADSEDAVEVEVEVVDVQGRVVPTADDLVKFSVAGPGQVVGVGNGDPSSHEPDKASQRHAFNGLCMALVGSTDAGGRITLTASAPGLQGASIVLRSRTGQ